MRLPNAEQALIPAEKLRDYLLNADHPDNRGKARLFEALGYERANWTLLEMDLREQHLHLDAVQDAVTVYGRTFHIIAVLQGPGRSANIKSVWQYDHGSEVPRLITAYGR